MWYRKGREAFHGSNANSDSYRDLWETDFRNRPQLRWEGVPKYRGDYKRRPYRYGYLSNTIQSHKLILVVVVAVVVSVAIATALGVSIYFATKTDTLTTPAYDNTTATTTPAPGSWSSWSDWSSCGVTCESGFRQRSRDCMTDQCVGSTLQSEICLTSFCPREAAKYGRWVTWEAWSPCGTTCGPSTQQRERMCEDEGGNLLACKGHNSQNRDCNLGQCPNCTLQCVGDWDSSCLTCECNGTSVAGRVVEAGRGPLDDVKISPSDKMYVTLASAGTDGMFTLYDICIGDDFVFHRDGYVPNYYTIDDLPLPLINMTKIVSLAMVTEPTSLARLVGSCVELTCDVSGTPPPDYFEWFKGGLIIEGTDSAVYSKVNLALSDSGEYRCRANNDYGAVRSAIATISVKDSKDDFCHAVPLSKIQSLPDGCTHMGKTTVDIGACAKGRCNDGSQTDCTSASSTECGTKEREELNIDCVSYSLFIFVTKTCGCVEIVEQSLEIFGAVVDVETGFPIEGVEVSYNGSVVATTSNTGNFGVTLPLNVARAVLSTDDPSGKYTPQVSVLKIPEGVVGALEVTIKMEKRGDPIIVSAADDIQLALGTADGQESVTEVSIAANSLYDEDGNLYTGEALMYADVFDPRDESQTDTAPGDFTAVDPEGEEQMLESAGMLYLEFKDKDGNKLNLAGNVTLSFDESMIGNETDENGISNVKLWSMNSETSRWEIIADIVREEVSEDAAKKKRRRRQIDSNTYGLYSYSSTVRGVDVDARWCNMDKVSTQICFSKVRVYRDNNFNENDQVHNANIQVISLPSAFASLTTLSTNRAGSDYSNPNNGYCYAHPCKSPRSTVSGLDYHGYVLADYRGQPLIPGPDRFPPSINYTIIGDKIYTKFDYTLSPDGPFYDWDRWWSNSPACSYANVSELHFQFYFEDDYCITGEITIVPKPFFPIPNPFNWLLWNPGDLTNTHSACFIKACYSRLTRVKFQAISRLGADNNPVFGEDTLYGVRTGCAENNCACLEVKSSQDITNGVDTQSTRTLIDISILGADQPSYKVVNSELLNRNIHDVTIDNNPAVFQILLEKVDDYWTHKDGIYCYTSRWWGNHDYMRSSMESVCRWGWSRTSRWGDMSNEGWAVKFSDTVIPDDPVDDPITTSTSTSTSSTTTTTATSPTTTTAEASTTMSTTQDDTSTIDGTTTVYTTETDTTDMDSTTVSATSVHTTEIYTTETVPVGWSEWSEWSSCDVICGPGSKFRHRNCSDDPCVGPEEQCYPCYTEKCSNPADGYGVWSRWSTWSDCSVNCGSGTHTRTRICNDNSGTLLDCVGSDTHDAECNDGLCADCTAECSGVWDSPCTKCECSGTTVTGIVMLQGKGPIPGVQISPKDMSYIIWNSTQSDGSFVLEDFCLNRIVLFHSYGFISVDVKINAESMSIVYMSETERLSMASEPQSRALLVGSCLTLHCNVTGNPSADYYEWFKDGLLLSNGSSPSLEIDDVQVDDSGDYRCRASNSYCAISSSEASITVRDSVDNFCNKCPRPNVQDLPERCTYENESTIDIGECGPGLCANISDNTICDQVQRLQCGPTEREDIMIDCGAYSFKMYVIKACGCVPHTDSELVLVGTVIDTSTKDFIVGVEIIGVTFNTLTSDWGEFNISLPLGTLRLVLILNATAVGYAERIAVVNISPGSTGVIFTTIEMAKQRDPIVVNIDNGVMLNIGDDETDGGFALIDIPPNSLYREDGTLVSGDVTVKYDTIDARDEDQLRIAPGDFTTIDDQGNPQLLASGGMMQLGFVDSVGNRLNLGGEITLSLNESMVRNNTDENGDLDIKFWLFNPQSARWGSSLNITNEDNPARRRRQISSSTWGLSRYRTTVRGIDINFRWCNFDKIKNQICHTKVRVFKTNRFLESEQITGASIKAITLPSVSSALTSLSTMRSRSDNCDTNGYCIIHPCNSRRSPRFLDYHGYILADYNNQILKPGPDMFPPALDYSTVNNMIHTNFDYMASPDGPFYDWDSWWGSSQRCSLAPFSDLHFQFYLKELPPVNCAISIRIRIIIIFPIPNPINWLLWNPGLITRIHVACYIKAVVTWEVTEIIHGVSKVNSTENDVLKPGTIYGVMQRCTENKTVCLPIKTSQDISDGVSVASSFTSIDVQTIIPVMPNVKYVNTDLRSKFPEDIVDNGDPTLFQMRLQNQMYGPEFGIYCYESWSFEIAEIISENSCRVGDDFIMSRTTNSTPAMTQENWAVLFDIEGTSTVTVDPPSPTMNKTQSTAAWTTWSYTSTVESTPSITTSEMTTMTDQPSTVTDPSSTTVTYPPSTTASDPSSTTVTDPSSTTVTDPSSTTITDPSSTTVTDPSSTTVTDPSSTTVTDPSSTTITDPSSTTVTDPSSTTVTDPSSTTVTDSSNTTVTYPTSTTASDPSSTTVTDPSSTAVTDPSSTTVTDPSSTTASDPSSTTVTDPSSTTVTDPSSTTVTDPSSTTVTDPSSTAVTDPSSTTASDPSSPTVTDPSTDSQSVTPLSERLSSKTEPSSTTPWTEWSPSTVTSCELEASGEGSGSGVESGSGEASGSGVESGSGESSGSGIEGDSGAGSGVTESSGAATRYRCTCSGCSNSPFWCTGNSCCCDCVNCRCC